MGFWVVVVGVGLVLPLAVVIAVVALGGSVELADDHVSEGGRGVRTPSVVRAVLPPAS